MQRAILLVVALGLTACVDPDLRLGRTALGQGDYPGAIRALERARARRPQDQDVLKALASAHRSLALIELAAARCENAAGQIAAADRVDTPQLADHRALHDCRLRHGAPPATRIAEIERLIQAGEARGSVLRELMRLYMEQKREVEALRMLADVERRFALSTEDRRDLVQVCLQLGDREGALNQLLKIRAADPMDPLVRLKIAELLEQQARNDEAGRIYRALTVDYRTNPVVFLRLADFLRRTGDAAGAQRAQDTADRLRGIQPDVRALRELPKSRN